MDERQRVLRWESRWSAPVAIATFLGVALLIASSFLNQVSGESEAEILRSLHEHSSSVTLNGWMQAVGFGLLVLPLFYLFRLVQARSPRVRGQMVGLIVVAPLFLAAAGALSAHSRNEAATQFVNGEAKSTLSPKEAKQQCTEERREKGAAEFRSEFPPAAGETPLAACGRQKTEDDEAENAVKDASLAPLSAGLGIAGGLGFIVALFYDGLWGMRTGVLTRFWGSLGMASGVAFLLGPAFLVTLIWLLYFGLLVAGWLPGGRPPAWGAGEARPWPTPGERAAGELEGPGEVDDGEDEAEPGEGRRKRKQRS